MSERLMLLRYRVTLEPVPQHWIAAFVTACFKSVERLELGGKGLIFGRTRPVLHVRLSRKTHLARGSRYECRSVSSADSADAPFGYATVRRWGVVGTTTVSASATNLLHAGDLATGYAEVLRPAHPSAGDLSLIASYRASRRSDRLTALTRCRVRLDLALSEWWRQEAAGLGGSPSPVALRSRLSSPLAEMAVAIAPPVLRDGRWDIDVSIEIETRWWARPFLVPALEYAELALRHRYRRTLRRIADTPRIAAAVAALDNTEQPTESSKIADLLSDTGFASRKFGRAIQLFATAWNAAIPELVDQPADQLAGEKIASVIFSPAP